MREISRLFYTSTRKPYAKKRPGSRVFYMTALQKLSGRAWVAFALLLLACGGKKAQPPPEIPHSVFLVATENNFVGDAVRLNVSLHGCDEVLQAQVLHEDTPVADFRFENNAAELTLPYTAFAPLYPELGIVAYLNLRARVKCDNGLVSESTPVGVSLFPAKSANERKDGITLMGNFFAIGGAGNAPTTFLGCAENYSTSQGPFLEHFDMYGKALGKIWVHTIPSKPPIQCNASTQISPLTQGHRWAYTAGNYANGLTCSLFAFRDNPLALVPNAYFTTGSGESCNGFSVDAEGNAFVVIVGDMGFGPARISANGEVSWAWVTSPPALELANFPTPPVRVGDHLLLPTWKAAGFAPDEGTLEVIQFDISNKSSGKTLRTLCGTDSSPDPFNPVTRPCPSLLPFRPTADSVNVGPATALSKNGKRLYVAWRNPFNKFFVDVYSLEEFTNPLPPKVAFWGPLDNTITTLSLSGDERFLVVSTPKTAYFLSTTPSSDGSLQTLYAQPLTVSGTPIIYEHLHGPAGKDNLILLAAPPGRWPLEAIAVDKPESGELWRFKHIKDGQSLVNAIAAAIDEGGHMWMRTGDKLIELFPQSHYRELRTPAH